MCEVSADSLWSKVTSDGVEVVWDISWYNGHGASGSPSACGLGTTSYFEQSSQLPQQSTITSGALPGPLSEPRILSILAFHTSLQASEVCSSVELSHHEHAQGGKPGSPRDAVGTTIWVTANGFRQRMDVIAGGSFASSPDQRPHFGLGTATAIDKLEVRWPSGHTETLAPPQKLDTFYTLTEGKGLSAYGK